jgi:hypothetical protein
MSGSDPSIRHSAPQLAPFNVGSLQIYNDVEIHLLVAHWPFRKANSIRQLLPRPLVVAKPLIEHVTL